MKALEFRIASAVLALFFAGHTFGGMVGQKSLGPASDLVFAQMKAVRFDFNGSDSSWYGFWFGFGLMASAYIALASVVAWLLGNVDAKDWRVVAPIAWVLVASLVPTAYLSFRYFFAAPGVFSVLAAVLLAVGSVRKSRAASAG